MSDRHWSHDWHGFDDDEDRSELMCHYCEICTCHSPEKSAGACERLAEVERAAAEKAWERFVDVLSAHHVDRTPNVVADMERRNPYRRNEGESE